MESNFKFAQTKLEGLMVIRPFYREDNRGFFLKSYEKNIFQKTGIHTNISEQFFSESKKGVLRGLHYQKKTPQSKLISVISGEVQDIAVDLRANSPTFGQWETVALSSENKKQLFIPEGFAHGFLTLSDTAVVSYLCSNPFSPETDTGIRWDDPTLDVVWERDKVETIILSEKDKGLPLLERSLVWN